MRLLAIDRTGDAANLGGMVRSASAFGADAVLLSHDSCDPWYRRAVRVSMGHVCRVPVVRSNFTLTQARRVRVTYSRRFAILDLLLGAIRFQRRWQPFVRSMAWCVCLLSSRSAFVL